MGVINLGNRIDELTKVVNSIGSVTETNTADIAANAAAIANTFVSTAGTGTDANAVLTPGIYSKVSGITDVNNRPANGAFILFVVQMTVEAYYTLQIWVDCTTGKIYSRVYRKSNTTWTSWEEISFVTAPTT